MLAFELLILSSALINLPVVHSYPTSPHGQRTNAGRYTTTEHLRARNIVAAGSSIADSYDFVIAGGGLAGLVLASRLSEDSNHTVLVLEAGQTGDDVMNQIATPGDTYYDSLAGSEYDWQYKTVAQPNAGGRSLAWVRGKVLGGSSAINGLYFVHPPQAEVDAWQSLISGQDGSENWNWSSFYAAMQKAETFSAPSSAIQQQADIQYTQSSFGSNGLLDISYPGYSFDVVGDWVPTLLNAGVSTNSDAYSGTNLGAFVPTSNINPSNWTRAYSRSAYIDPLPPRSNLDILPQATVTQLIFSNSTSSSGNLTATAVQYAATAGAEIQTVKVNKEVILCGGSVGSPQMLMVSGVGPSDVLSAAGVDVLLDLPGVGAHLQDHLAAGVSWSTSASTMQSVHASGNSTATSAAFMSFVNSATAYVNTTTLLGSSGISSLQSSATGALSSATSAVPGQDSTVIAGYQAIYDTIVNTYYSSGSVGVVEILLTMETEGSLIVQAALQHPLSAGRVYINSSSAFDNAVIDPQYLSQASDITLLREGLKLARQIGSTAPLSSVLGTESVPGTSVSSDSDWDTWLAGQVVTEYHPCGSCAMLGIDKGGVVNPYLQVYGLENVRVADASVFPMSMSTHFGAPTYGLAEQAATIIRSYYNVQLQSNPSSSTSSPTTSPSSTAESQKSSASSVRSSSQYWMAVMAVVVAGAALMGL